jgi:hypothetical protein
LLTHKNSWIHQDNEEILENEVKEGNFLQKKFSNMFANIGSLLKMKESPGSGKSSSSLKEAAEDEDVKMFPLWGDDDFDKSTQPTNNNVETKESSSSTSEPPFCIVNLSDIGEEIPLENELKNINSLDKFGNRTGSIISNVLRNLDITTSDQMYYASRHKNLYDKLEKYQLIYENRKLTESHRLKHPLSTSSGFTKLRSTSFDNREDSYASERQR